MKCEYCGKSAKHLVFESSFWKVFLASDQAYLGRCVVILKRHCGALADLKEGEWADLGVVAKNLESSLKAAFNATMFNWTSLMNDAYKKQKPNPHLHWHFRPRYNCKVKFAGLTFEDKEFGSHYDRAKNRKISEIVKGQIIQKIKNPKN